MLSTLQRTKSPIERFTALQEEQKYVRTHET